MPDGRPATVGPAPLWRPYAMNLGFLSNLTILASTGGAQRTLFEEIAMRWEAGQWGMYPIAVCLVFSLAIMIERGIVLFGKASINKDAFLRGLKKHIYAGDLDKAINYVAGQKQTPLTQVIKAGLMNVRSEERRVGKECRSRSATDQ